MKSDLENYSQVKERLDVIVDKVTDENISLDEALDLYDEAVSLASRASELIDVIEEDEEDKDDEENGSEANAQDNHGAEVAVTNEDQEASAQTSDSSSVFAKNSSQFHSL